MTFDQWKLTPEFAGLVANCALNDRRITEAALGIAFATGQIYGVEQLTERIIKKP